MTTATLDNLGEAELAELQLALLDRAIGPHARALNRSVNERLRVRIAELRLDVAAAAARRDSARPPIESADQRWRRQNAWRARERLG